MLYLVNQSRGEYANMHFYDLKSVLAKNDNVRLILSSKYKRLLAMENTFTCMIILYNFTFTFETRQINIVYQTQVTYQARGESLGPFWGHQVFCRRQKVVS